MFGMKWLYEMMVNTDVRVKDAYENYVKNNLEFHKNNRMKSYRFLLNLKKYYKNPVGNMPVAPLNTECSDIQLIKNSTYFDGDWYLKKYPDVRGMDPADHYLKIGWIEYKSPGPSFSTLLYLNRYDDAREMGMNPLLHYEKYGKNEKRVSSYSQLYKSIQRDIEIIEKSAFWNERWYLEKYLNNQYYIEKPIVHYYCLGCYLNMNPGPTFSQSYYEKFQPSVLERPYPHLLHYEQIGKNSGRGYFNQSSKYYENLHTQISILKDINLVMCDLCTYAKRKVLLISHVMNLTGAPKVLVSMAKILKKNNFYPVVATLRHGNLEKELMENNIPVVLLAEYEDAVLSEQIINFVNAFDVVLFNTIESLKIAHILSGTKPYKMGWFHEGNMTMNCIPQKQINRLSYCNKVFVCAEYCRKFFEPYIEDKEIEILYYGVNEDIKRNLCSDKSYVSDKFIITIIGTISYRKGHDILFDSLMMIPNSICQKMEFHIIGSVIDSEIGKRLDKICSEYSNVLYYGEISNIRVIHEISETTILVVPSRDDPMPVVIAEAMILKKPVLMSKQVGTCELVKDSISAFVLAENTPLELSKKLIQLYDNRDSLYTVGERGYEVYMTYLSEKNFEKRILQIFSNIKNCEAYKNNIDNEVRLTDVEMLPDGIRIIFICAINNKLRIFSNEEFYDEDQKVLEEPRWQALNIHLSEEDKRIAIIKISVNVLIGFSGLVISDYFDGIRLLYADNIWSNLKCISDTYGLCVYIRENIISFTNKNEFEQFVIGSPLVKGEIKNILKMIKGARKKVYSLYVETRENANDNAYQLFKYDLMTNNNAYFVTTSSIVENEKDQYLKEHYLIINSAKAKQFMIESKMIVCSWFALPIYGTEKMSYLYPFINLNYVFVPHGISYDKNSFYLNKSIWGHFSKCIVSSKYEKNFFEKMNGYSNVEMLGYPRMDKWKQTEICSSQIILFPSWRKEISQAYIETLINIVKNLCNYDIIYIAHPSVEDDDYWNIRYLLMKENPDIVCIHSKERDLFNKYFASAKFLVTDYSSVAYDFAYKGGVSIYYEPFLELESNYSLLSEFYEHHCGIIVKHIDELKFVLIDENALSRVEKRVKDFFEYTDNNTVRVFEFINREV